MTNTAQASSRRTLILLALVFSLGLIISYVLYYSGWRPSTTNNYGELVQPARPLEDTALTTLDGKALRFSALHGKWTLITFSASPCLSPCERNLYKMRQVIAAQGENAARAQSVLVMTDGKALDRLRDAVREYPRTRVVIGPPDQVAGLARQFALPAGSPLDNLNRVYLVDPLGNFVMSYPVDADPNGMRKDLAHLMKISQIG